MIINYQFSKFQYATDQIFSQYFQYIQKLMAFHRSLILFCFCALVFITKCEDDHHDEQEHDQHMLTKSQIWGFGILAGIGISLIGFLAAIILLVAKKCASDKCFQSVIKFLFALACGALLGDAIIHIMAQSYANEETNNRIVSLIFIVSILLFLLIDRAFHAFGISHSHWVDHDCSEEDSHKEKNIKSQAHKNGLMNKSDAKKESLRIQEIPPISNENLDNNPQAAKNESSNNKLQLEDDSEDQKQVGCLRQFKGKNSNGYLNLLGSLVHNFIDGIALGVAFSTGDSEVFVPVLVAIIAHQIPRQLGDVAILLKSSFTEKQTILCNGTINLISILGTVIGLAIVHLSDVVKAYIMIFVAGNFIYIAADIWRHIFKNKNSRVKNFTEFIGLGIGVGAMFALTAMQSGEDGHSH